MVVVEAAMEDSWCVKYFLIVSVQSFFVASCIASPVTVRRTKMVRAGWDRSGAGDDLMLTMWMIACCNQGHE